MTNFTRGALDEIIPPPLLGEMTVTEAINELVTMNRALGKEIDPSDYKGEARATLEFVAQQYVHQLRLRDALAGKAGGTTERALYEAVVTRGEALRVCPLGWENVEPTMFYPILQRVEGVWRFGDGRGLTALRQPDAEAWSGDAAGEAVVWAQELFATWWELESDAESLGGNDETESPLHPKLSGKAR
jgi:hypothetical protein